MVVNEVGVLKRSRFGSIYKTATFKYYFSCGDHLWRRTGVNRLQQQETAMASKLFDGGENRGGSMDSELRRDTNRTYRFEADRPI
jgi:hypothetical protein